MHEETRIGHLVERRQGGDQDGDATVAEQAGEEKILCQFGLSDGITSVFVG